MQPISKPWWEQVTALISLSVSGAVTGFSFVPKAPADLRSPSSMPIQLLAMEQTAQAAPADDTALRSAIVNVANYFLRMAATKTPAEMEAIIWHHDSIDGVDHGESCAAFASLTLEMAAHVVGQQSWVTGGTTYPWPLHKWADVRVGPNPDSLGVTSVLQDAQAHQRWHPLGDGYTPQPGDWVLFDGHVEVVTNFSGGVLHTIGGDSLPNFSVNAHRYPDPLSAQGVVGFVNNGDVASMTSASPGSGTPVAGPREVSTHARHHPAQQKPRIPGARVSGPAERRLTRSQGDLAIPGLPLAPKHRDHAHRPRAEQARASRPVAGAHPPAATPHQEASPRPVAAASPSIPGVPDVRASAPAAPAPYTRHHPAAPTAPTYHGHSEQAFIDAIAPGAIAAQRRYGVPASVTIAQAIDESGWGRSVLATRDNNLFGIKGIGPAGSAQFSTSEYQNGQLVPTSSGFRIYYNIAESINDHGKLLATSSYYRAAMASRKDPNAFAAALTGVYATDPQYGAKIISIMQRYDLYRYDTAGHSPARHTPGRQRPASHSPANQAPAGPGLTNPGRTPHQGIHHPAHQPITSLPQHSVSPTPSAPAPTPSPAMPGPSPQASPPIPKPRSVGHSRQPGTGAPGNAGHSPLPGGAPASGGQSPQPGGAAPGNAGQSPRGATGAQGKASQSPGRSRQQTPQPGVAIPGLPTDGPDQPAHRPAQAAGAAAYTAGQPNAYQVVTDAMSVSAGARAEPAAPPLARQKRQVASRRVGPTGRRYQHHIPPTVWTALIGTARAGLLRGEPLYRDITRHTGLRWEFLAACDWMQCKARQGYSPVHGEKLGSVNTDGTIYHTKSEALEQCATDLEQLARTVYGIDVTAPELSVCDLANVFAAFRWGGLLKLHHTSAMEFPYSVAGLTAEHTGMRWPTIDSPHAPDKPGGRFRPPFGAVPIVLSLHYPATV